MYKRPVMTHVDTASRLVCKQPALVYWTIVNPTVVGTAGTLQIYDGWDTAGVEKVKITTGYDRCGHLYPPVLCGDALYIEKDSNIGSYTIGYLPESVAMRE